MRREDTEASMDAPARQAQQSPWKGGKQSSHTRQTHFLPLKLGTASLRVGEATQGRREQRRPEQGRAAAGRDSQEIKGRVQDMLEQAPC